MTDTVTAAKWAVSRAVQKVFVKVDGLDIVKAGAMAA